MSYFLIGEIAVDDGPLFVLWTRSTSGVRVLPIGSRDRRDMQAVGRRLIDDEAPGADPDELLELIVAGSPPRADGQPLRLVDLDDSDREAMALAIASDLDLAEFDERAAALREVVTAAGASWPSTRSTAPMYSPGTGASSTRPPNCKVPSGPRPRRLGSLPR